MGGTSVPVGEASLVSLSAGRQAPPPYWIKWIDIHKPEVGR